MRRGMRCVIAGGLLLLAACGSGPGQVTPGSQPVRIEVSSEYGEPLDIYVIGSGTSQLLGRVQPGTSTEFTVPPGMINNGSVALRARPDNQHAYTSGPLLFKPGRVVELRITSQLFNSTATIRD